MLTMLFGCSAQNKTADIDIIKLCSELLDKAEFEDELSAVDEKTVKKLSRVSMVMSLSPLARQVLRALRLMAVVGLDR